MPPLVVVALSRALLGVVARAFRARWTDHLRTPDAKGELMAIRSIGIVVALWLSVGNAFAICPYPKPKVCSTFFESDAVFVGTVLITGVFWQR
jgi:hypothetical protein